jgi:hypothetical protein
MWWQAIETYLVARLLASPSFHKAIRRLHGTIHALRSGEPLPPREIQRTKLQNETDAEQRIRSFWKEFREEVGRQAKGNEKSR